MNLKAAKQALLRMMPSAFVDRLRLRKESEDFNAMQSIGCNADNLRPKSELSIVDVFDSSEFQSMWSSSRKEIDAFTIPDGTGGVNPGDRRALYFLISKVQPLSVLEIGTHIGASTVHIASALKMIQKSNGNSARLTSVDFVDVNSPTRKPWLENGTNKSPREMIEEIDCGSFVEFITDTSLHYMANCERKFDFIFLDGDHTAKTVYQEIPAALDCLSHNGVILLHDYFPDMQPLWSDGTVLPGPFLATERLREEGVNVTVLPLGNLPWATKLQSNATSLALLLRNQ